MSLVFVFCVLLTGCIEATRKNLNKLHVGMTRAKVFEIMGTPYRREAKDNNEWLLYQTEERMEKGFMFIQHHQDENKWLTPLMLENGKLRGWGSNYWSDLQSQE